MVWTAIRGYRAGVVAFVLVVVTIAAGCGGGDQPPPETQARTCQQTCQQAEDCGEVENWQCVEGFCQLAPTAEGRCLRDRECWAKFSGWSEADCHDDGESCALSEACILVGNITYCAPEAPEQEACPVGTPYDAELADGSGRIGVCANQQARCEEGTCRDPCASDLDCAGDRICDTTTGRCQCTSNSDCTGELVCDQGSGECVCRSDEHCTREGAEVCYSGTCGCADDEACEVRGGSYACAPVEED